MKDLLSLWMPVWNVCHLMYGVQVCLEKLSKVMLNKGLFGDV